MSEQLQMPTILGHLVRNVSWRTIGELLVRGALLFLVLILAREAGPEAVGTLAVDGPGWPFGAPLSVGIEVVAVAFSSVAAVSHVIIGAWPPRALWAR